jgi:hypothetical protein
LDGLMSRWIMCWKCTEINQFHVPWGQKPCTLVASSLSPYYTFFAVNVTSHGSCVSWMADNCNARCTNFPKKSYTRLKIVEARRMT